MILYERNHPTAVVCFARMNPPTVGHLKLVNKMKQYKGDKHIFLSHSLDADTDPLPYKKKKWFVKQFFPDVNVGHDLITTPIKMMSFLEEAGYDNVIMVTGSDRLNSYINLLNKYNGKTYSFKKIDVINAGNRDNSSFVSGISSSKMRKYVKNNDFAKFKKGVPNMKLSNKLFDEMKSQMIITESDFAKLAENSSIELNYPSLIAYIKKELVDYIDHETDVDKLIELLRQTMHKSVKKHGKKFTVTKEKADSMVESIVNRIDIRNRNTARKLTEQNGLDIYFSNKPVNKKYHAYAIDPLTGKHMARANGINRRKVIESITNKTRKL